MRRPCESRCAHKFLKRKQRRAANNTRLRNYCAARNCAAANFYSVLFRLPADPPVFPPYDGSLFIFYAAGQNARRATRLRNIFRKGRGEPSLKHCLRVSYYNRHVNGRGTPYLPFGDSALLCCVIGTLLKAAVNFISRRGPMIICVCARGERRPLPARESFILPSGRFIDWKLRVKCPPFRVRLGNGHVTGRSLSPRFDAFVHRVEAFCSRE